MRLGLTNTSLQTFEVDVNVSNVNKAEVFKFLAVILKNLLNSDDPKFRQLRLSNAKIQRITAHAAVMSYLQQVVGFEMIQENGESLLRIVGAALSGLSLQSSFEEVTAAKERVTSLIPTTVSNSSSVASLPELTSKQKTRKMMEEKAVLEKEAVKKARKQTVANIKADKHVRENDPNWKPAASAAAAKSGVVMNTFRDKFGEE
jgi:hypothetical protein